MIERVRKKIGDIFDLVGPTTGTAIGSMVTESLIGQIAPGVITGIVSYRQKRTEKMVFHAIEIMGSRIEQLEYLITKHPNKDFVIEEAFPLIWDYVFNETQLEKINLIINGLETLLEKSVDDIEKINIYYEVLESLSLNEVEYLLSIPDEYITISEFMDIGSDEELMSPEYIYRTNKLDRYGLIKVNYSPGNSFNMKREIKRTKFGKSFIDFFRAMSE